MDRTRSPANPALASASLRSTRSSCMCQLVLSTYYGRLSKHDQEPDPQLLLPIFVAINGCCEREALGLEAVIHCFPMSPTSLESLDSFRISNVILPFWFLALKRLYAQSCFLNIQTVRILSVVWFRGKKKGSTRPV
jgi:hypothetical protein